MTDRLSDDIVEQAFAQRRADASAARAEVYRISKLIVDAINTWFNTPINQGGAGFHRDERNPKFWFNFSMAFESRLHTPDPFKVIAIPDPFPVFYSTNDYDKGNIWRGAALPPGVTVGPKGTQIWTGQLADGSTARVELVEDYSPSQW